MIGQLSRSKSILLICDILENFAPKVYSSEGVIEASLLITKTAKIFDIPIITTEHNVKSFGRTIQPIRQLLTSANNFIFEKSQFSMLTPEVQLILKKYPERNQIILIGMEAHVCMLQTSLALLQRKYQLFLPLDAITSIRSWERTIALSRLQQSGANFTSFQSLALELVQDSKDSTFKPVLQLIKFSKREKAIAHL